MGNHWACLKVPVLVVTTSAPPIAEDGENMLLRKQLGAHQQEVLALKQQLQQQQNQQQPSDQDLQELADFIILSFNFTQLTQQGFVSLPNIQLNQQPEFPTDNKALFLDNRHEGSVLVSQMNQRTSS